MQSMDAAGDLFGTTSTGGASGNGTVFELVKSGGSYSSTPTVLVSFDGTNGAIPLGGLIMDSAGDLLGTLANGGANGDGTVFEVLKNGSGYNSTPLVPTSFNGTNSNMERGVYGVLAQESTRPSRSRRLFRPELRLSVCSKYVVDRCRAFVDRPSPPKHGL
jgi:uncharacterized repeat protein (TIGR03803 family)